MKKYLFTFLTLFLFISACNNCTHDANRPLALNVPEAEEMRSKLLYGFSPDTLVVHEDRIGNNEFLSNILTRHNIDYTLIDRISKESKKIYDVRKLQSGKPYCILKNRDSIAQCFVYEPNDFEYVVYDFRDKEAVNVYIEKKPVEIREKVISGIINNSLYVSMERNGGNPTLAIDLADVYAWSVDFYRIQAGDRFKIVFDEKYVDGKAVGSGKIKAAYLQHKGEDYYAFDFEQNGVNRYYDDNAKSLKKAFLKAPLKFSRISSRYTMNRYHPVLKRNKPHLGTDYAAPHGTPIMSTGEGTVVEAGYTRGNGKYVKVKHNGTYTTQYLHMSKFAAGMKKGKRVRQGEVIGYVGSTGLATGPHVCYRFWKNGKQVDPYKEKTPPAEPVSENNMAAFEQLKQEYIAKLNSVGYETDPKTHHLSMK